MPLYEYKCDACGNRFEKIVKFSDPPLEECPACGGKVQKLFSSPAIQFKGSGFYITDYAKKSSPESSSGKSTAEKSGSEKSSDKSSDSSTTGSSKSDSTKTDSATPAPAASSTTSKE
jgi:putative FmdB family regulatory protein